MQFFKTLWIYMILVRLMKVKTGLDQCKCYANFQHWDSADEKRNFFLLSRSTYLSNVKVNWSRFHCDKWFYFVFVLQETFTIVARVEQCCFSELSLQLVVIELVIDKKPAATQEPGSKKNAGGLRINYFYAVQKKK